MSDEEEPVYGNGVLDAALPILCAGNAMDDVILSMSARHLYICVQRAVAEYIASLEPIEIG